MAELLNRAEQFADVVDERGEESGGDGALEDPAAAIPQHQRHGHRGQTVHRGVEQRVEHIRTHCGGLVHVQPGSEFPKRALLVTVQLHCLNAGKSL